MRKWDWEVRGAKQECIPSQRGLWLELSWSDGDKVCVSPLSCPVRGKGRAASWGSAVIWGSTLRRSPCFVESSVLQKLLIIFKSYSFYTVPYKLCSQVCGGYSYLLPHKEWGYAHNGGVLIPPCPTRIPTPKGA